MLKKTLKLTRRAFLKRTAAVATVPYIVQASALGRDGKVPASERIILGGIGIRNRGSYVLQWMLPEPDVQFVAVCDAQKASREAVKKMVDTRYGNKDCAMYSDIREFLATRTDIDAVLIATGDRWHALASIMAMRAGKDVYSEKPSCYDYGRRPGGGGNRQTLWAYLSNRHATAQRGKFRLSPLSWPAPVGSAKCTPLTPILLPGTRRR